MRFARRGAMGWPGLTELGKFAHLQHILVELVVVADREDDLVEPLELLDVVGRHIAQLDPAAGTELYRSTSMKGGSLRTDRHYMGGGGVGAVARVERAGFTH